jgi:hypothetical protein
MIHRALDTNVINNTMLTLLELKKVREKEDLKR